MRIVRWLPRWVRRFAVISGEGRGGSHSVMAAPMILWRRLRSKLAFRRPTRAGMSFLVRRVLWSVIAGLVVATIIANLRNPIVPGWEIPLAEAALLPPQLYSAKAATLAVLGAGALAVSLWSADKPTWRISFVSAITSVVAAGAAGWFWLLSATDGNPVPFLIALVPAVGLAFILIGVSTLMTEAQKADEQTPYKLGVGWVLFNLGFWGLLVGVVVLLAVLPSRLF